MTLGSREIQQIIPHRWPFLLVDKIIDLKPGEEATGIKNVTADSFSFRDIFQVTPYFREYSSSKP